MCRADGKIPVHHLGRQTIDFNPKLAQSQNTLGKIMSQLKNHLSQITLFCFINSLDYLVEGGRANHATGFIYSLINLKLALSMPNGELKVVKKVRGKHWM